MTMNKKKSEADLILEKMRELNIELIGIQQKCKHEDATFRYNTNCLPNEISYKIYTCPTCFKEWEDECE